MKFFLLRIKWWFADRKLRQLLRQQYYQDEAARYDDDILTYRPDL